MKRLLVSLFAVTGCVVSAGPPRPVVVEAGPAPMWAFCANEHQQCNVGGTAQVRYGADGRFAYRTVNGGVPCENGVFGDPAYGVVKACYVRTR